MADHSPPRTWLCTDCGYTSAKGTLDQHECQPNILAAYQKECEESAVKAWVDFMDESFGVWLDTPAGRFAKFLAERAAA